MHGPAPTSCRVALAAGSILLCLAMAQGQPTPPISPQIEELPLPPLIELPGPENVPADVPNRPLTAEEAAAIALHYQPVVSAANAGLSAAAARLQQAQAGLRPSLAVGGSVAHVHSDAVGGGGAAPGAGPNGFQVSATLRQLVYDFNHTRDLVRQASARQRSAGASLTAVQADLVFRVKLAFYVYMQNTRMVQVSESTLRNQQGHLALAQARLNSGLGLPLDVVRAETAYAQAVYGLTVARNYASLARVNLAELMGIDPRTPIEPAEGGEPAPAERWRADACRTRSRVWLKS